MQKRKAGKSNLEVADSGFGCVPDADRVEISDRKREAHSPAEGNHASFIEKRPHPFLRDSPLEFGVGIFVGAGEQTIKPGDVAAMPGWVEHEAFFPEDTEVVDFFAPVREDFLTGEIPAYMAQR